MLDTGELIQIPHRKGFLKGKPYNKFLKGKGFERKNVMIN